MNPVVRNGNKLRWKFENIKDMPFNVMDSDDFSIDNLYWSIRINRYDKDVCKWLDIDLCYESYNKYNKNWMCEIDTSIKLLNQNGNGKHLVKKMRDVLCEELHYWGIFYFIKWDDLISTDNGYLKDDSIVIEIEFDFKYYDFSRNIPNFTDIIVNVEETDFHVNKGGLSSQSKLFYDMFVNKKCEDTVIKLDDVGAIDFRHLLASFDPFFNTVTHQSYKALTKIAKLFGTPSLHYKCEQFLITYPDMELIEKIKYAEEYGYETLMKSCIEALKTGADINNLHANVEFSALKETTKLRIMQRFLEIF